jgi:hypothetical protein
VLAAGKLDPYQHLPTVAPPQATNNDTAAGPHRGAPGYPAYGPAQVLTLASSLHRHPTADSYLMEPSVAKWWSATAAAFGPADLLATDANQALATREGLHRTRHCQVSAAALPCHAAVQGHGNHFTQLYTSVSLGQRPSTASPKLSQSGHICHY